IATIATIGIGVVLLYIVLYSVLFLLSLTVIDGGYLGNELGHPDGLSDYFGLSWLSSSPRMLAGALGSNFNDPDSIREGTYSKRVYQRRNLADEFERAEDSDNEYRLSIQLNKAAAVVWRWISTTLFPTVE